MASSLTAKQIDDIVRLYNGGDGERIADLARAFETTAAAIRYHLKARDVLVLAVDRPRRGEEESPTDEDLGIGEGEEEEAVVEVVAAAIPDISGLLNHPDFAKVIDALVNQRLAALQPKQAQEMSFDAFLKRFEHIVDAQAEQRPGYFKPLSAEERDFREQGKRDMFTLLARFKAENTWPHYLLADEANPYYGPSINGLILYQGGQEIMMRGPPSEGFKPLNESAIEVFEAYKRWVGEPISMEALTAEALAIARGDMGAEAPQTNFEKQMADSDVRLVDKPLRDVGAKRVLGTMVPEVRGKTMPRQPGVVAQPSGPVFVSDV